MTIRTTPAAIIAAAIAINVLLAGFTPAMAEEISPAMPVEETILYDGMNLLTTASEQCEEDGPESPACAASTEMIASFWETQKELFQAYLEGKMAERRAGRDRTLLEAERAKGALAAEVAENALKAVQAANAEDAAIDAGNLAEQLAANELAKARIEAAKLANELAAIEADGALAAERAANALEAEQAIDPIRPVVPVADIAGDLATVKAELATLTYRLAAFCTANAEVTLCEAIQ